MSYHCFGFISRLCSGNLRCVLRGKRGHLSEQTREQTSSLKVTHRCQFDVSSLVDHKNRHTTVCHYQPTESLLEMATWNQGIRELSHSLLCDNFTACWGSYDCRPTVALKITWKDAALTTSCFSFLHLKRMSLYCASGIYYLLWDTWCSSDVLCCTVLCCAVLWRAVLCSAVQCSAVLCCAVLWCTVVCSAVQCCAVLCSAV